VKQAKFNERILPILQRIGNQRIPYLILSENKAMTEQFRNEIYASATVIEANTVDDSLIDKLLSVTTDLCIVYTDKLTGQIWPMQAIANEMHANTDSDFDKHSWGFKNTADGVYTVKSLDYDIIAYAGHKSTIAGTNLEPWQPWHTLMLDEAKSLVYQVIWDLRVIVGYKFVNEIELLSIRKLQPADDNRRLLFNATDCEFDSKCMAFVLINIL
jgi:hypothetical protein